VHETPLKALWYHHASIQLIEGIATILIIYLGKFCKIYIFYVKT